MVPFLPVVPLQVVVPHLPGKSVPAIFERREDVVAIPAVVIRAILLEVGADHFVQEHPDPRLDRFSANALLPTMPDVGVVQLSGEARVLYRLDVRRIADVDGAGLITVGTQTGTPVQTIAPPKVVQSD